MTDNIIPFEVPPEKPKQETKCSFCGKAESQVRHMISNGIDKHICNECVVKAKERLEAA
jgi:hypothetical protein